MIRTLITPEEMEFSRAAALQFNIARTKASPHDSLIGAIGEVIYCHHVPRKRHEPTKRGEADYNGIEVKCSLIKYSRHLHLLVREDYARARKPRGYVQIIIDKPGHEEPEAGDTVIIVGWATAEQVDNAELKDMGSKFGGAGGYRCRALPLTQLRDIRELVESQGGRNDPRRIDQAHPHALAE